MSIDSKEDLIGLKESGRIAALALREMSQNVRPGISELELNDIGAKIIKKNGAKSAPMEVYGFPKEVIISINDEVVHGIPSNRTVKQGDVVKLDVTIEKDGYYADTAVSIIVPPIIKKHRRLVMCAKSSFERAMKITSAGTRIRDLGKAIQDEVENNGFTVIPDLCGHGIGRTIHEKPSIPNYYSFYDREVLTDGLVITVEPIITEGNHNIFTADDGWTIKTSDGKYSSHYEHTLVVTRGTPIILTQI